MAEVEQPVVPKGPRVDTAEMRAEFEAILQKLRDAAASWGLQPYHPEGIFISTMIGTQAGFVNAALGCADALNEVVHDARLTTEVELKRLKALNDQAQTNLNSVKFVEDNLKLKREDVEKDLIARVVPGVIEGVRKAVVIKEQRFNKERNRYWIAATGVAMLFLVLLGYVWGTWSDWGDSRRVARVAAAVQLCRDRSSWIDEQKHRLCDVETLDQAIR